MSPLCEFLYSLLLLLFFSSFFFIYNLSISSIFSFWSIIFSAFLDRQDTRDTQRSHTHIEEEKERARECAHTAQTFTMFNAVALCIAQEQRSLCIHNYFRIFIALNLQCCICVFQCFTFSVYAPFFYSIFIRFMCVCAFFSWYSSRRVTVQSSLESRSLIILLALLWLLLLLLFLLLFI